MERSVQCCIAGGGPAGMMLGLLLARAGIKVLVLEKHRDFLRDFRGDTVHPSTLELMHELGVLEEFLRVPHQKVAELNAQFGDLVLPIADFSRLPVRCPYIAMVPQWDFLDFLARKAALYPGFSLMQSAEVTDLRFDGTRVCGVRASTPDGALDVTADLVVGADGRHSLVRERAQLSVLDLGAPIDALWFRLSRQPGDSAETMARFDSGSILVMLNRGDYWQCAFVIAKGGLEELKRKGLESFRATIAGLMRLAGERLGEISSWDDVKLLTVQVNRLREWCRPGLLCIGDAAHAMSPVGGVGINLAVQDAVAAANVLWRGDFSLENLKTIQQRREFPTRLTQAFQLAVQNNILQRVLQDTDGIAPPLAVRMLARFGWLRRIPARMVGLGARPEHIRSPDASAAVTA
jgi:2-polyprenyl-6-methoxyphenol hydroxylase-like FAD-dependent oxidoreductase